MTKHLVSHAHSVRLLNSPGRSLQGEKEARMKIPPLINTHERSEREGLPGTPGPQTPAET